MSYGQFGLLWVCFIIALIYYWFVIHSFENEILHGVQGAARSCGVLSIIFLSFMFLTVTRIRLWNDCFGITCDHLILYHKLFAYCMLGLSYAHMLLWIIYWSQNDSYTVSENFIFSGTLPFTYISDNWTIAMAETFLIFFVPFAYFIGSSSYIRNKFFEIFYTIHIFAAIVFVTFIFWHATQSWRYMLPCLILYFIDRCLRFYNSTNIIKVNSIDSFVMDRNKNRNRHSTVTQPDNETNSNSKNTDNTDKNHSDDSISSNNSNSDNNEGSVVKLGFRVAQVETEKFIPQLKGEKRAFFGPLRHKMGQYCFVNMPKISPVEWHPFTISSGPYQNESTIHVRSMGINEFSGKLCELARQYRRNNNNNNNDNDGIAPIGDLEVHIDGPYGKPFNYCGYDRIVLVAGGIGVTPCHSIISGMMALVKEQVYSNKTFNTEINNNKKFPFVHLIWIVRDPAMFDVFKDTWKQVELLNRTEGELFMLDFYHSRPNKQDATKIQVYRQSAEITYKPCKPQLEEALKFLIKQKIEV